MDIRVILVDGLRAQEHEPDGSAAAAARSNILSAACAEPASAASGFVRPASSVVRPAADVRGVRGGAAAADCHQHSGQRRGRHESDERLRALYENIRCFYFYENIPLLLSLFSSTTGSIIDRIEITSFYIKN